MIRLEFFFLYNTQRRLSEENTVPMLKLMLVCRTTGAVPVGRTKNMVEIILFFITVLRE